MRNNYLICQVRPLTGDATPSSDKAGLIVGEDKVVRRETSGLDGVREGDRRLQLDQGNVVTVE